MFQETGSSLVLLCGRNNSLNCYQFPSPKASLCFDIFTSQSLTLGSASFCFKRQGHSGLFTVSRWSRVPTACFRGSARTFLLVRVPNHLLLPGVPVAQPISCVQWWLSFCPPPLGFQEMQPAENHCSVFYKHVGRNIGDRLQHIVRNVRNFSHLECE